MRERLPGASTPGGLTRPVQRNQPHELPTPYHDYHPPTPPPHPPRLLPAPPAPHPGASGTPHRRAPRQHQELEARAQPYTARSAAPARRLAPAALERV